MKKHYIIVISLISITFFGCGKNTVGGNGKVTIDHRNPGMFNSISIKGAYDVVLIKSDSTFINVEADANLAPVINTIVNDSVLEVFNDKTIIRSKELRLIIACPNLRSIDFSGATELSCDTTLKFDQLSIIISGAGRIDLDFIANNIKTNVSGGAELMFKGKTNYLDVSITGTGNLNATGLQTNKCSIDISGFGWAKLNVKEKLEVNISGFGKIEYTGNPYVKQSITGGAKVKHIENGQF